MQRVLARQSLPYASRLRLSRLPVARARCCLWPRARRAPSPCRWPAPAPESRGRGSTRDRACPAPKQLRTGRQLPIPNSQRPSAPSCSPLHGGSAMLTESRVRVVGGIAGRACNGGSRKQDPPYVLSRLPICSVGRVLLCGPGDERVLFFGPAGHRMTNPLRNLPLDVASVSRAGVELPHQPHRTRAETAAHLDEIFL